MGKKIWLIYALVTTITWVFWGALSSNPIDNRFPSTGFVVVWFLLALLILAAWGIQTSFMKLANAGAPLMTSVISFLVMGVMPSTIKNDWYFPGGDCGAAYRASPGGGCCLIIKI